MLPSMKASSLMFAGIWKVKPNYKCNAFWELKGTSDNKLSLLKVCCYKLKIQFNEMLITVYLADAFAAGGQELDW